MPAPMSRRRWGVGLCLSEAMTQRYRQKKGIRNRGSLNKHLFMAENGVLVKITSMLLPGKPDSLLLDLPVAALVSKTANPLCIH